MRFCRGVPEFLNSGRPRVMVVSLALCALALFTTSCGGSGTSTLHTGPPTGGPTTVAIQLSSTGNDQFIHFNMTIEQISLTNQAGKTTTIFSTPTDVDFIPSNGNAAPFATASVPQDVYTAASVTLSVPRFSYVSSDAQGNIYFTTDSLGVGVGTPPVVTLPSPITVGGSAMGLTLNLQTALSGSFIGFPPNQISYTLNPTFTVSSFAIPTGAETPLNGACIGIAAQVTAINSSTHSITVVPAGHPLTGTQSFTVAYNSGTQYQGISSASGLSVGSLVNMDLALQPDASYAATRIDVQDALATNVATGQLAQIAPSLGHVSLVATEEDGNILSTQPVGMGYQYGAYTGSTTFQTSARFPNLGALPFAAIFTPATLVAGQEVSVGSTTISFTAGTFTSPTSITLVPQTIDAVVSSVSNSGSFTVYTVQLASYDPIVQLNNPAGPVSDTRLPGVGTVNVYVDSSTSLLNSTQPGVGGTFRFNGLLFNDGGVLRMACDQVSDGIPQ